MEGKFTKKKGGIRYFFLLAVIVCGLALIKYIKTDGKTDPSLLPLLWLIPLAIGGISVVCILLYNHGAYFRIEDGRIKAKFNWLAKLDCPIEDVVFVNPNLPVQGLTLLFKDGKQAVVSGMENFFEISYALRKQIFSLEKESPEKLMEEIKALQKKRKKQIGVIIAIICAMFALIFVTVALTGGRDLGDFNKTDWIIFSCFIATELLLIIFVLRLADQCGKTTFPIEYRNYRLNGAMILSQPLPPCNAQKVYTDESNDYRVIVSRKAQDESTEYIGQVVNGTEMETVFSTKNFSELDELTGEKQINELIDITENYTL